jgi:hypothetical protein
MAGPLAIVSRVQKEGRTGAAWASDAWRPMTCGGQRLGRRAARAGRGKRTSPETRGALLLARRCRLVGSPRLALGSLKFSLFNSVSMTQRTVQSRFRHLGCGFLLVLDAPLMPCRALFTCEPPQGRSAWPLE